MANYTADQLTQTTDPSAAAFACAPFAGGNSLFATVTQIVTYGSMAGGLQLPSNSGGAGYDLTLSAGDAGASGRGGNLYLKPGAQNTTGGNGSVIFLDQTGATLFSILSTGALSMPYGYLGMVDGSSNGAGSSYTFFGPYMGPSAPVSWTATHANATADTQLYRSAAGMVRVTSGSAGTVGGSFTHPKGSSNLTVTGTTNNLALDASAFQRLTGSSTPVLTGVAPPSGGAHVDGNIRYLYCLGATSIQLNHNDGSSTAANRLYMSTGANITLAQNQSVRITYDATDNGSGAAGWRCTSAT